MSCPRLACRASVLLALLLGACVAPTHRVHYSLLDAPRRELPRTVVILPAGVRVYEVAMGGVAEEATEWNQEATRNLVAAVEASRLGRQHFEVRGMPALTGEAQRLLDEHLALFDVVVSEALEHTTEADGEFLQSEDYWQHKVDHFDYTLGDGLRFLAERSGAEAAVLVTGYWAVPTAQHMALSAVFDGSAGEAWLCLGLVDLHTGDLLWLNEASVVGQGAVYPSFRDRQDTDALVELVAGPFPGLEEYDSRRTPAETAD